MRMRLEGLGLPVAVTIGALFGAFALAYATIPKTPSGYQVIVDADNTSHFVKPNADGSINVLGGGGGGGPATIVDGGDVTLGAKADAKSTATDTTPITIMSVLKQISASAQSLVTQLPTLPAALGSGGGLKVDGSGTALPVSGAINSAAATTGGASSSTLIAAATTNSTLVSAGVHTVYDVDVENNSSTIAYLKLYDKATAPTCNSDTPVRVMIVPGNAGGSGFMKSSTVGIAFTLGVGFCLTGGIANNDNTSVAATTYTINIGYK